MAARAARVPFYDLKSDFGILGNGSDVSSAINDAIASCSTLASATNPIRLYFPDGTYLIDTLRVKSNVHLDFGNAYFKKKTAGDSASMVYTDNNTLSGGSYYGQYSNIKITGGIFDGQQKTNTGAMFRLMYVDDLTIEDVTIADYVSGNWAFQIGGRSGRITGCRIKGGSALFEDGIHLMHGQDWVIADNLIQSGDDAIALGGVLADSKMSTSPDPIRYVTVANNVVKSNKGAALKVYTESGSTGTNWEITDVDVTGLTGQSGITRNGGVTIIDQNAGGIGASQIQRINVEGELAVGGPSHDGTSPYGLYVLRSQDITANLRFNIDASAQTFTVWKAYATDKLTLAETCRETVTGNYVLTEFTNGAKVRVVGHRPSGLSGTGNRYTLLDDFEGVGIESSRWTTHLGSDGDCAATINVTKGGEVELASGNDAGGSMALNGVQLDSALVWSEVQGADVGLLAFEARVRLGGAAITNVCAFVGMTDQNSALEMPFTLGASNALTSNATDAIGFLFDTAADSDNWWAVSVSGDTDKDKQDLGVAPVVDTYETLGFEVDINGKVTYYRNRVKIGSTYASGAVGSVGLTPVLAVFARGASQRRLRCDYIRVESARAA